MRSKKLWIGMATTAVLGVWFMLMPSEEVNALANPLSKARAFQVDCTTAVGGVAVVSDAVPSYKSVRCMNASATQVFIGGDDVNTSDKGYPICTAATCIDAAITVDLIGPLRCISGGSVTLTCIGAR